MGSDFEEIGPELGVGGEISRVRSKLLYPQPRNIAKNSVMEGKVGPGPGKGEEIKEEFGLWKVVIGLVKELARP